MSEDIPFGETWEQRARRWQRERDEALAKLGYARSVVIRMREQAKQTQMDHADAHDSAIEAVLRTIEKMPGLETPLLMALRNSINELRAKK